MLLYRLVDLYSLVVFAAVIISWIPEARDSSVGRAIDSVTEPVFGLVRRVLPPAGGFDLSPMVVLLALQLLKGLLRR
ncbi:MAG TPA: YggT family protein [Polyangiaceae bacterium]|nr:YggT family protein [Polyangiaceae bacterium]